MNQPILPLSLLLGNVTCSLPLSGTSKKLFYDHHPSYSFASDDDCDRRNREMDAALRAGEKEARNSSDYEAMMNQTRLLDGVFPEDHVSPYYTIVHFDEIHQRERRIISLLATRMRKSPCFHSVIQKYDSVASVLNFMEIDWIQTMREKINNKTATAADLEDYKQVQNKLVNRRMQHQQAFHNVKYFSDSSVYCDGCLLPPIKKSIAKTTSFPNGFVIRKFVGDKEVPYSDSSSSYLERITCRVVSIRLAVARRDSDRDRVRIQSPVFVPSVYVSLPRVGFARWSSNRLVRSCWWSTALRTMSPTCCVTWPHITFRTV